MSDEYTPTTRAVKQRFTAHLVSNSSFNFTDEEADECFDRWLEAHDREVAERAWDAACSAFSFLPPIHNDTDTAAYVASTNPYREGATS